MSAIPGIAGRVLLLPKGTWAASHSYEPYDLAYYEGSTYLCKFQISSDTPPSNDTVHWQLLAAGYDIAAINNLKNAVAHRGALVINIPSFDTLPQTVSSSDIESDMVAVRMSLTNQEAQTGTWTITTSQGSMTLSGNISGSTAVTLYLMKQFNAADESGGIPGTTDYTLLSNKPSINGVTLVGDKSLDTLGIQPENEDLSGEMSNEEIDELLRNTQ